MFGGSTSFAKQNGKVGSLKGNKPVNVGLPLSRVFCRTMLIAAVVVH